MANVNHTGDRAMKWMRWIARGVGSSVVALWLFMGIAYDIVESRPWTLEDAIMAGLVITSALGVLIAWWREGIGGTILVICAAAHSTFAYVVAGHNKGFAMLISGGPFLLIGSLFLAVWWRLRHRR